MLALEVGKFLAEAGQFPASGLGRIAVGTLRFGCRLVNRSHQCALLLQPHLQHVAVRFRSLLPLGELDEPRVVILPAAPFPRDARDLDVEVLDLADHVFECRRGRALAQLHAGRCRVQQAHGFVGQLPLGQVPDAQPHGLDHGFVQDAHLVVLLHRLDDGAHHADGLRLIRFLDAHFLEAALQSRVAFEVLLVFVEGGGRDGAEFAASQGRFQEIRGVVLTGRAAGPDHRVRFIDEQNDRHGRRLHFLNHGLEAVLELALHPGSGLEQAQIERAKFDVAKGLGHVAGDDPHREPFDHRGLADAGFARQDRVVLPSPREDVDDLANLGIAAENAVDLPLLHGQREVVRVLIQARRLGIPRGPRRAVRQGRGLSGNRRSFLSVFVRRATFQNRLQLGVQTVRGNATEFRRGTLQVHGQGAFGEGRDEQVPAANLRAAVLQRREHPRFPHEVEHFHREARSPAIPGLEVANCRFELLLHLAGVDLEVAKDRGEIAARALAQFDEPVFDLDGEVGLREAQPRGRIERSVAGLVEFLDERAWVDRGHGRLHVEDFGVMGKVYRENWREARGDCFGKATPTFVKCTNLRPLKLGVHERGSPSERQHSTLRFLALAHAQGVPAPLFACKVRRPGLPGWR